MICVICSRVTTDQKTTLSWHSRPLTLRESVALLYITVYSYRSYQKFQLNVNVRCICVWHRNSLIVLQSDLPTPYTYSSEGAYTFPHSKHYTIDDIIRLCVSHYSSGLRASIPANSIVQNESVFFSLMPHRTPINTAFMPITFRCEITSHRF